MYYVLLILLHLHTTNQRSLGIRSANFRPILPIFFWEWALSMHVFHSSRLQLGENIYEGAFSFSGTTFQQLQWDRLSKSGTIPGPVLDFDRLYRPVPSLGKILSLFCCPFVPGQGQEQKSRDKLLCPKTFRDKMNFYLSNSTKKIRKND